MNYRNSPEYVRVAMIARSQRKRMRYRTATLQDVGGRPMTCRGRTR